MDIVRGQCLFERTELRLGKIAEIGGIGERGASQLGELLRHVLDHENAERVGAKGLLQRLKGDIAWREVYKSATTGCKFQVQKKVME